MRYGAFVGLLALTVMVSAANGAPSRKAFVVGLSEYDPGPYPSIEGPDEDAKEIATVLSKFRFDVKSLAAAETTLDRFKAAWKKFVKTIKSGDEVFIYYSGHGSSVSNRTYFIPRDYRDPPIGTNPETRLISLEEMKKDIVAQKPGPVIWVLDACRDVDADAAFRLVPETLRQDANPTRGLTNHLFIYSITYGRKSLSSSYSGGMSFFTKYLVTFMKLEPKSDVIKGFGRDAQIVAAHEFKAAWADHVRNNPDDEVPTEIVVPPMVGGIEDAWCLDVCLDDPRVKYADEIKKVDSPTTLAFAAAKGISTSERGRNAVFMGRKLSANNCDDNSPGRHPFGCSVLGELAKGNNDAVAGKTLTARTDVNMRRRAPIIRKTIADKYACEVDVIREGQQVRFESVISKVYNEDAFYWGLVKSSKSCLPKTR